ncbi:50S ribosomal protein L25 [Metabacillus sp. RGM 3146]|uniref:50S ribosomal protein L25 n=1 Tax=Metabacillus sp. RGM 3146 TaxID=3401092 RepID=UPI003B99AB15
MTTLVAKERKESGNSSLHQLRNHGKIPSVVYGKHKESKSIVVKNADLLKTIREVGRNGIISLDINGKLQDVILADYQYDPINYEIFHADFLYIDLSTEIHAQVHVALIGTSQSVEEGIQQSLHELSITAKPNEIPETIEVDISDIHEKQTIKIGEIRKKYSNITINHEDEEAIVSVLTPRQEEEQQDKEISENEE